MVYQCPIQEQTLCLEAISWSGIKMSKISFEIFGYFQNKTYKYIGFISTDMQSFLQYFDGKKVIFGLLEDLRPTLRELCGYINLYAYNGLKCQIRKYIVYSYS